MTDGNTIRSVAKAMELLQLLSDAGEAMTLSAISERAGLPKSTVFGLLTTMRDYDVITQHLDGKYALGLRLFEYGCRASRPAEPGGPGYLQLLPRGAAALPPGRAPPGHLQARFVLRQPPIRRLRYTDSPSCE